MGPRRFAAGLRALAAIVGKAVSLGEVRVVILHGLGRHGHESLGLSPRSSMRYLLAFQGACDASQEAHEDLGTHYPRDDPAKLVVGVVWIQVRSAGVVNDGQKHTNSIRGDEDELRHQRIPRTG